MHPLLPFTLVSFIFSQSQLTIAGNSTLNGPCLQSNNKIQPGTLQLSGDCGPTQFCNSAGQCQDKGCRRDDFPFGYNSSTQLPDKCPKGQFCPDEGDACLELLPVNSPCQLNRDDECEPPPDFKDLAGTISENFNGSICLRTICMWANVTVGQPCIFDNTPFISYTSNGSEFIDVVSRGNCRKELYCDASQSTPVCVAKQDVGGTCGADKECLSNNCLATLTCGAAADAPKHFPTWVYAVVAIAIIGGMVGTLTGLFFLHSRSRDQDREKRMQYWREQNAFRQNILQMRETARSGLSAGYYPRDGTMSNRSSRYGLTTEDSQVPMLGNRGGSGLRNAVSDDDSAEEALVVGGNKSRRKNSLMNKLHLGKGKSSNTRI